mmetsp:Transcript_18369/g.25481  ORF Transcript_18369/g.25481 Transcript_18369/m.25481 type:complete len:252 (-) Transcript_18369:655-1410(-)
MMKFIPWLKTTKNTHSVLRTWLINHDLLETTLQSFVSLDVFSVLINSCSTNTVEFTTSQCWLQEIRSIHRSLSSTSPNDRMHFVNEQNDFSITLLNFLKNSLETFFEFTTHTSTSHKCTKVEPNQTAWWLEGIRDIPSNHTLCNALRNSCLTDTRISNKDWIILGSTRQNLNSPTNFVVSPNDRIELSLFGTFGKINPVFEQGIIHAFSTTSIGRSSLFPILLDRCEDFIVCDTLTPKCFLGECRVGSTKA